MMGDNPFIHLTLKGLQEQLDRQLLAPRAFGIGEIDDRAEDCILIMGLNPAGGRVDAEREKDLSRTYFYCLYGNSTLKTEWLYNKYYRPILNFANECLQDYDASPDTEAAKWPWCNKAWDALSEEIRTHPDLQPASEIEDFYRCHQRSRYTIYIGDMFYYHVTNSKILPLISGEQGFSYRKYCSDMLALHIEKLERHNKRVKFVYINNAQVSHWLSDDAIKTFDSIPGTSIKVFYGGMLSGMRSLDAFSRERLVKEIRREIQSSCFSL